MLSLAEENWDLFLDLMTAKVPAELRRDALAYIQACACPSDYIRLVRAFSTSTVSDLLERVQTPVLILHSLDQHWLSVYEGTRCAAKVAGARLVFLDGDVEPKHVEASA